MKDGSISISIPTHCRPVMLAESFGQVLDDPRVKEVAISDDHSEDGSFEQIVDRFSGCPKIRIGRNDHNLDCYRNKRRAVEMATSAWTILFDDDNIMGPDYVDRLFALPRWDPRTLYCPDWAKPTFNYTAFADKVVDRSNVGLFMAQEHFATALNTANYFVHRATYLKVWDGSLDPITADSMFHAHNHLVRGGKIIVVSGLRYIHRIHDGSHYKRNVKRTGDFGRKIEQRLRALT